MFPIPSEDDVASVRAELGLDAHTPVVLGVFRLSAEKAPLSFVEACARIIKSVPDTRAFIVGMGPMQPQIEALIAELGLQSQIILLGRRSDVNALMRLATVFLLTSEKEGMPNVLMEAQLMATPIVATSAGGTSGTIIEGKTGMLCPVGDVEGLASACVDPHRPFGGRGQGYAAAQRKRTPALRHRRQDTAFRSFLR